MIGSGLPTLLKRRRLYSCKKLDPRPSDRYACEVKLEDEQSPYPGVDGSSNSAQEHAIFM